MSTLVSEKWISIDQAAAIVGKHPQTVRRWADTGLRGTPPLYTRFIGGCLATTVEHLERFLDAYDAARRRRRPEVHRTMRTESAVRERLAREFGID